MRPVRPSICVGAVRVATYCVIGRGLSCCYLCFSIETERIRALIPRGTGFAPAEEREVLTESRWLDRWLHRGALQPLLTLGLTMAVDALAARLVPRHAVLEPSCR